MGQRNSKLGVRSSLVALKQLETITERKKVDITLISYTWWKSIWVQVIFRDSCASRIVQGRDGSVPRPAARDSRRPAGRRRLVDRLPHHRALGHAIRGRLLRLLHSLPAQLPALASSRRPPVHWQGTRPVWAESLQLGKSLFVYLGVSELVDVLVNVRR